MKLLESILLADDFSKSSKNVISTAIEFAKVMQSKIIPIHVLPDDILNEKVKTLLKETAKSKLNEIIKTIKNAGVETSEPILKFGSVSSNIVRTATKINANLILIGSGESLKADKFQLGTTTERIIQKSEKPVFAVKAGVPFNVQNILCPIDFSDSSRSALKNAIVLARRFRAELTILGVCEVVDSTWVFISDENISQENETRHKQYKLKFDTFLKDFNLEGVNWIKETPKGNPAEEILSTVSRKMVDLLIMGTAGRSGLNRMVMGSVTEKVIREVPCSFITSKSKDLITLHLENDIKDIDKLYKTGIQLLDDGFYEEAIEQFKFCLNINILHVPAYFAIAKVYEKLKQPEKAKFYKDNAREIKNKMLYPKIEDEVRKLRGS